jgi:hypothetical protein
LTENFSFGVNNAGAGRDRERCVDGGELGAANLNGRPRVRSSLWLVGRTTSPLSSITAEKKTPPAFGAEGV